MPRLTGNSRFERNHEQAQRSAKSQLEFIEANIDKLAGEGEKGRAMAVMSFSLQLREGRPFTPAQLSYIDGLYERVMKAHGLPSVPLHVDRKRKGLRFG